jgi:flagellar hook-basal body complex protein FliE
MAILPIPPIQPISIGSVQPAASSAGAIGGSGAGGGSFLDALDKVSEAQAKADKLAVQAATGDLHAVQDFTIASTEAQLLTQMTVSFRDKAISAFNDIMRMQI